MPDSQRHGAWVIVTSFIVALMLTMLPLPTGVLFYRPEWVALILIYWCLALPERVGVGAAWCMGLLLDVLTGTLLGQHALSLALIAYITARLHRRMRLFPVWQQAIGVLLLVALNQLLLLWIKGILGQAPDTWQYWLSPIVSMLLWPFIFVILRQMRRRFISIDQ